MNFGPPRRPGRPTKGEGPRVPYEELDRILVFGEVVPCEDGHGTTVVFPSYRELADRYGVSHSVITEYAKTRNVQRRRKEGQMRIQAKVERKVIELRSDAIAFSKDDQLRLIDTYLAGFEKALADGRVRFDNPTDANTMIRLREFLLGNADSRQEIHASLSLESLQARHRQMIRVVDASPAERGEIDVVEALPVATQATQSGDERSGDNEIVGDVDEAAPRRIETAAQQAPGKVFPNTGMVSSSTSGKVPRPVSRGPEPTTEPPSTSRAPGPLPRVRPQACSPTVATCSSSRASSACATTPRFTHTEESELAEEAHGSDTIDLEPDDCEVLADTIPPSPEDES